VGIPLGGVFPVNGKGKKAYRVSRGFFEWASERPGKGLAIAKLFIWYGGY